MDSDFRDTVHKISGRTPIYFLTGDYDFACTPDMTLRTAEKVKGSETTIFSGGHFPTSEDPAKFKDVITPVLKKILQNDPERRGGTRALSGPASAPASSSRPAGRRVIDL